MAPEGFPPGPFPGSGQVQVLAYAFIIFWWVTAYIIPGLLLAGVGTLISLQRRAG